MSDQFAFFYVVLDFAFGWLEGEAFFFLSSFAFAGFRLAGFDHSCTLAQRGEGVVLFRHFDRLWFRE